MPYAVGNAGEAGRGKAPRAAPTKGRTAIWNASVENYAAVRRAFVRLSNTICRAHIKKRRRALHIARLRVGEAARAEPTNSCGKVAKCVEWLRPRTPGNGDKAVHDPQSRLRFLGFVRFFVC